MTTFFTSVINWLKISLFFSLEIRTKLKKKYIYIYSLQISVKRNLNLFQESMDEGIWLDFREGRRRIKSVTPLYSPLFWFSPTHYRRGGEQRGARKMAIEKLMMERKMATVELMMERKMATVKPMMERMRPSPKMAQGAQTLAWRENWKRTCLREKRRRATIAAAEGVPISL